MENLLTQVDGVDLSRDALDSEDVDQQFREAEEEIHVTRKQSYLSSKNVLSKDKEGKIQEEVSWDELDVPELAKKLDTSFEKGLTSDEAEKRLSKYGPNELEKAKRPGFCTLFLIQLLNLIIILLIAAAVASIAVNAASDRRNNPIAYVEGIAIFVIVILNAGIGAYTENQAAGALEALSKLSQPKATVLRNGEEVAIKSVQIVPGDVVLLGTGDITPADVRLIEADDLKVNEMLLTGEPDDVSKFARMKKKKKTAEGGGHDAGEKLTPENMAFSSCMVTNGKAKTFVVETGMNTRVGKIAQLLAQSGANSGGGGTSSRAPRSTKKLRSCNPCACLPDTKSNQTPLQKSLQDLGVNLGIFAIVVCFLVFIIGVALQVQDLNDLSQPTWLYMILIAVTLAVAAIPEGIPLCVTISLSTGCSHMVKKNVLVRRIAAVETLGCASVICTDKTGTLTEGKMTMVKMWSGGVDYNVSGKGFNPTTGNITYEKDGNDAASSLGVQSTLASALLCCNTTVKEEEVDGERKWVPYGNSSEAPIVVAAAKVGLWATELEKALPRVYEVPFASSRKMMLTVCQMNDQSGNNDVAKSKLTPFYKSGNPRYIGNVKGAPNFILDLCDSWMNETGEIVPLTEEDRANFLKKVDSLSSQALRVLAVAARVMEELPFDPKDKDLEWTTDQKFDSIVKQPGLVLLGLVASIDPERDGVAQAVLDAQGGHIRVVMITGDYLPTAIAIAHNVNILKPEDDVKSCALDCASLRPDGEYLDDDGIDNLTQTIKVFARAQPEDKLEIVKSLQRQGLVSAMTGDGVNDAPALKKADIGVAMGIQGTEVAKGASDMILTDDNFVSIVVAVEKGRIIYAGIQKFVAFILSVHLAEVLQIFICIVAQIPIMRTPLQILFLILVTDLPPSIALGMERAAPGILNMRPRPKKQPIVLGWMWWGILANGLILTVTTLAVYIWGLSFYLDNNYTVDQISALIIGQGENCTETPPFEQVNDDTCFTVKLDLARTSAFISLVWSENVRAYASRSFNKPVYVDLCGNPAMQKAIFLAQVALYIAVFVPGLSEVILNLRGYQIGGAGWIAGLIGACGTLILCELYKVVSGPCITAQERRTAELMYEQEKRRLEEMVARQTSMTKQKELEPEKGSEPQKA